MKRITLRLAILGILLVGVYAVAQDELTPPAGQATQALAPGFQSLDQQMSYALGLNMGRSVKETLVPVDQEVLLKGIQDGLGESKARLDEKQTMTMLQKFSQKVAQTNIARQKAFLERNKSQPGVKTTESGLQYKVLQAGTGQSPVDGDRVKVHYEGTLINGDVFDSSYRRGEPISFGVNGVIPGWTEALKLMKVGDKWQLFIPSELGYGPGGNGTIGPHATLVFTVELLGVEK